MNQENKSRFPAFFIRRRTAILLTASVMVLALLAGGYFSLLNKKNQVYNIYLSGEDNSGKGIKYDLEQIEGEAANLVVVAQRYMDSGAKAIVNLEERAAELDKIQEQPERTYGWAMEVLKLAEAVDAELQSYKLTEQDESYRRRCLTNIESHIYITENSGYNQEAEAFNQLLSTYPAKFWRQTMGIGKLKIYE